MKASNAFLVQKPTPLQHGEMKAIASEATAGSTSILSGRIVAFLRRLSGVRNPSLTAWKYQHLTFVPVVVA